MLEAGRGVGLGKLMEWKAIVQDCCGPYLNLHGQEFQNSTQEGMPGDFFQAGLRSRRVAGPPRVSISSCGSRLSAVIETLHTAGLQWRL